MDQPRLRAFTPADTSALVEAWNRALPTEPMTVERFRRWVIWDRNFDPSGLLVAERSGRLVGACQALVRRVAAAGDDLEPEQGWISWFFVVPEERGQSLGRQLLGEAMAWLREQGRSRVDFSPYTPNYLLPGIDGETHPHGRRVLDELGFSPLYEAVAMERSLAGVVIPPPVLERVSALREAGWRLGTCGPDDVHELLRLAGDSFNPDWERCIREGVVAGLPLERITVARNPEGRLLGWAMFGAYEDVLDRFGPFGVHPDARGTGLGEVLLHLTQQRMAALGAHHSWFLWTGEQSAAGHLYRKAGYTVTRRFTVMRAAL